MKMFSCCRANPKNAKVNSKKVKHKIEGGEEAEDQQQEQQEQSTADEKSKQKPSQRQLTIPTITIENGRTTSGSASPAADSSIGGNGVSASVNDDNVNEKTDVTTTDEIEGNHQVEKSNISKIDGNERNSTTEMTETEKETEMEIMMQQRPQQRNAIEIANDHSISNDNNDNDVNNESTANRNNDDETPSCTPAASVDVDHNDQEPPTTESEAIIAGNGNLTSTAIATNNCDTSIRSKDVEVMTTVITPKSCLSRHNSMHTSIKKKVNISNRAEIIEPVDPPPYTDEMMLMDVMMNAAYNDDDDDDDEVFSDSLPPPKRESMCAPYIERNGVGRGGGGGAGAGDELLETLALAHGLPEWFNDERINDIGCIEPPVTPVGRDELELKRQRLYSDLLRAAQAAVAHNIRFVPPPAPPPQPPHETNVTAAHFCGRVGGDGDCDPGLRPSVAENLENLVNRLERLVDRLERSISARELDIANHTFDTILEKRRESIDLPASAAEEERQPLTTNTSGLAERIGRIESSLNEINDRHRSSRSHSQSQQEQPQQSDFGSLENIPTVLDDYQEDDNSLSLLPPPPPLPPQPPSISSMSVSGYQDIVSGPLSQYLALSAKIGGDVAKHAELVKKAFDAQLQYVVLATQCSKPNEAKQMELLKPTSDQINAIQEFREKNRTSPFFNHLSAISESIPALGWVCVSPTPGPHVKEMNDAGQFYTNRVLKDWKEKDKTHVDWARAWIQTLVELQAYIKQYHTTGLVWSGKGAAPAAVGAATRAAPPPPPPIGGCPPPPPPPAFDLAAMSLDGSGGAADERSALFAEINQGEAITKSLKKVTADMQTHKNPTLRTGPAPFKTPTAQVGAGAGVGAKANAAAVSKPPVFARDGKKWIIEYQKNNSGLLVENAEMNNVIYMFRCEGSTLTVKGKVNNIVMDSCKKCSLLFDSVVASVEFVNCQSVQMQVLGFVPTISVDKTDGCQMYLCKESLGVEIVSSKSSEMNVMLPNASGDFTELAIPEQYKTTISGKNLKTVCVESLG